MRKKKSYMNNNNILNEGFFDKISKFLKSGPKLSGKKKSNFLKGIKIALATSRLNSAWEDFEEESRKVLGKDFPEHFGNIPKLTPKDFIE